MIDAQRVIDTARTHLGIRFRYNGRDARGLDCVGLVKAAFAPVFDLDWPVFARVATDEDGRQQLGRYFARVPDDQMQPADVLLYRFVRATHIGLYTGSGVIHAAVTARQVVEQRLDHPLLAGRLVGVYRLKEPI